MKELINKERKEPQWFKTKQNNFFDKNNFLPLSLFILDQKLIFKLT